MVLWYSCVDIRQRSHEPPVMQKSKIANASNNSNADNTHHASRCHVDNARHASTASPTLFFVSHCSKVKEFLGLVANESLSGNKGHSPSLFLIHHVAYHLFIEVWEHTRQGFHNVGMFRTL